MDIKSLAGLRQRRYVSFRLQGALLVALVALELIMVLGAVYYLYGSFAEAINNELYSVHRESENTLMFFMFKQLLWTVLVMSLINIAALLVAHIVWTAYVKRVLVQLREQLQRVNNLDLSHSEELSVGLHEVIAQLGAWSQGERQLCLQLRELLQNLPHSAEDIDNAGQRQNAVEHIMRMEQLLAARVRS